MNVVNTIEIEGIYIPIDEYYINKLELYDCRYFRNIIVIRCNYLNKINKYITAYEPEKKTLKTLINLYTNRLKSLHLKCI